MNVIWSPSLAPNFFFYFIIEPEGLKIKKETMQR